MTAEPDFALDDLDPADLDSEQAESVLWAGDLYVLAEYHTTPHGSHSYFVAHDQSATWGAPGAPQLVAVKIARNFSLGTFTLESACHAALPFAQSWLIERGCPPEKITVRDGDFMAAADDLTGRIEQKVRDGGQRYEVLETQTWDYDPCETWTLARDTLAAQDPIRVFLEQGNPEAFTYTLREGAFPDEDTAQDWLDDRNSPLPGPPEDRNDAEGLRTRAALTRSAGPVRGAACGLDRGPVPSTPAVRQQDPGRSR
ncbi:MULTISPECIES: glycosyl hydrolase [unclassified Streptomyces]|uniref:glycosyl hydrolase n=1 Tax=unclassified Streptomyces TaxID=2593676 RepID=UPI002E2D1FA0|nr:glycosyl hydrolase [Streptomyces sp. NBC_00223]